MRLKNFILLLEGKKLKNPMIGFGFKYSDIKNIVDYVESVLKKHKIKYYHPDDYHLSLAQILGNYDKDELVRKVNSIKPNYKLNPIKLKILRGKRVPKDFIVIEYKPNYKFVQDVDNIMKDYNTVRFGKIIPHVSLFMIDHNELSEKMIKEMNESAPKLKPITPIETQIWNAKHSIEYRKR